MNEYIIPPVTKRKKVFGLISIASLILFLGVGIMWLKLEPQMPLILATIVAASLAVIDGEKWEDVERGMYHSITMALQAIIILMVIGVLISSWIIGGIVPTMIVYGLDLIDPAFFFVTAMLLSSIVALATGSSWTTAGTVGIALMGIANAIGINPAMAAGSIVSGAYFGDKMSPLSDTTNLAPALAGTTLFQHIKSMTYTTVPSYIIALVLYLILGFFFRGTNADLSTVVELKALLNEVFNISIFMLIPPILVIVMVVFKIPALPGLLFASFLGVFFAIIFQGALDLSSLDSAKDSIFNIFNTLHYGYVFDPEVVTGNYSQKVIEDVDLLVTRGGLNSMMWTISLILVAMCFGGVMEYSGMLHSLVDMLKVFIGKPWSLALTSILTGFAVNLLAADQYLSIVIPGRMYKEGFEELNLHPRVQSRILEAGGTLTSPLVPWNTCGATMGRFLGVESFTFAPFAFFNLINPVIEVVALALGWAAFKADEDIDVNTIVDGI